MFSTLNDAPFFTLTNQVIMNVNISTNQNDIAESTNEQFDTIKASIYELSRNVQAEEEKIHGLKEANAVIVDSVNTLSASSEEISASVTEACGEISKMIEEGTKARKSRESYLVGHTWKAVYKRTLKRLQSLEGWGSVNVFSFFWLGYLLHYVEDFFTFPHNEEFKGNIVKV